MNDAYTHALRLEMIRKKVEKKELVEEAPVKHGKHTRAVEVQISLKQRCCQECSLQTIW